MARKLYIDTEEGRFVEGLNSSIPPDFNTLFEGDIAPYELYFVRRDPSRVNAFAPEDFSGASVKFHIGPPPPSTATAYVAQQTWTNLPTTVSATVTRTVEGGVAANEQQTITFSPEALSGTFALTFPARTIALNSVTGGVFTTVSAHGLTFAEPFVPTGLSGTAGGLANDQQFFVAQVINPNQFTATSKLQTPASVTLAASGVGSIGTITATSRVISARATAAQAQATLEAVPSIGFGNINVLAAPGQTYRLGYQNDKGQIGLPAPTVTTSSLAPAFGKTANVNFNTVELTNAISASASIAAVLEVEATESGKVETFVQVPVTLRNDIIASGAPTPVSTISGSASFSILSPDSSVWAITIDNDGILTASKL